MHKRTQQGQALIGMAIAVGLLGMALTLVYQFWRDEQVHTLAEAYGQTLSQYAVGLRGYVAAVQGGSATLPANPYTVNGTNWLKPPTCGGLATNPAAGYVPCSFDGGALGPNYQTTVTKTPATNAVEARANFFVPFSVAGANGATELAAEVVNSALAQQDMPASGTFYAVFANTAPGAIASVRPDAIAPADRGRVLAVVNNAPSQDPWLRTDGTNKMLADLDVGGHSITNAKDGNFSGDLNVTGDVKANNLTLQGSAQINKGLTVNAPAGQLAGQFNGKVQANDVMIAGINRYASQGIYDVQTLTGAAAYTVAKPDCSAVGGTPRIYVALQSDGGATGNDALYDADVSVADVGTAWTVVPQIKAIRFWLTNNVFGTTQTVTLNKAVSSISAASRTITAFVQCQ